MLNFFDKLEDKIREHLSRYPIIYSIVGGTGIVLFWRGVWETAEILSHINPYLEAFFYPPVQIIVSILGLMAIGLMVSIFIGDRIILSGLKHEKKVEESTEALVEEESVTLKQIKSEIADLKEEIEKLAKEKGQ
ncbi:MAG: hypothetical protein AAB917_01540 [Patescibacteria group bacterium]